MVVVATVVVVAASVVVEASETGDNIIREGLDITVL